MLGVVCITAIHVMPSGSLFAAGAVEVEPPPPSSWSDRADGTFEAGGTSDGEFRSSLEFLLPLYSKPRDLLFAYPLVNTSGQGQRSYDLGLGFRNIFEKPHVMVGGNIFYDGSESAADHPVSQRLSRQPDPRKPENSTIPRLARKRTPGAVKHERSLGRPARRRR